MTDTLEPSPPLDLAGCDREPIHIPEAVQPHGLLFVVDPASLEVRREAGRLKTITGRDSWLGLSIAGLLGDESSARLREVLAAAPEGYAGRWRGANGLDYDLVVRTQPAGVVLEVEQSSHAARLGVELISRLDAAAASLERADSLATVCERAAEAFRRLTGFDRVMIYRFLDDAAGQVVAESCAEGMESFRNHRFPGSDIPRQARALYVRNPVRVIPDSDYQPQPLRPAADAPLDMSDCALRSVSPIHLQYLRNMGVRASASMSIIVDDQLWGLVACHSPRPQLLPYELRMATTNLARVLSRQIKARADAELYRERLRLRQLEDDFVGSLPPGRSLARSLSEHAGDLVSLVDADGLAVVAGRKVTRFGSTPSDEAVLKMAGWVAAQPGLKPLASYALSELRPEAAAWTTEASGLLGLHLRGDEPLTLLWFRAEIIETVRWAGNPSTAVKTGPAGQLTPRASFEAWSETVRGRSRRWTPSQIESAQRLRVALLDFSAMAKVRNLNRTLRASLDERDLRLGQQEFLIREVNHRVQNSLTLVSSFLGLQARQAEPEARRELLEARRRVRAVSLVHSRLYRAEMGTTIDLGRYFAELIDDLGASMGEDWAACMTHDLAPVRVEAGRAVTLGLVLTELIINAQKYAYDGQPGPIRVALEEESERLRLAVEDKGKGGHEVGKGFGSMMIGSLVAQLGGELDYRDAAPGLRVVLRAPLGEG